MPPADDNKSAAEREFANDMDVGLMYFGEKNHRGAEFRYRDALLQYPDSLDAIFWLAQSLDRQSKNDEARTLYRAFLSRQTSGVHADLARKRLQHLEQASGGKH